MREETEYSDSHFEGSINIPVSKFWAGIDNIPKEKTNILLNFFINKSPISYLLYHNLNRYSNKLYKMIIN